VIGIEKGLTKEISTATARATFSGGHQPQQWWSYGPSSAGRGALGGIVADGTSLGSLAEISGRRKIRRQYNGSATFDPEN
jgi:hypothetical protein